MAECVYRLLGRHTSTSAELNRVSEQRSVPNENCKYLPPFPCYDLSKFGDFLVVLWWGTAKKCVEI